ncbi:hypothetical protein [Trichococcus pasteurii]|uniref:Uncharacterized protein n=1 Tax=Trichococcus pasteurii TaxID=43064 RepID=A0A1W1IJR4_9LACT|nr:hypothetical protein [Trichococcus pasteurii]SFF03710.1 hypothetical protein SAMN04488086_12133 [Trichococcus pasteurii]SLM53237.1 Hypothetical protein TPAS_2965 [Trichococcus pasteurii]SSB94118.1 Hypothetical protein TPAS_2965 [Trichococcus pasteurii]
MTIFIGIFSIIDINSEASSSTDNIYIILAKNFGAIGGISSLVFLESLVMPFMDKKLCGKITLGAVSVVLLLVSVLIAVYGARLEHFLVTR